MEHKLIIVDDERIVRESLKHWFEEEGYIIDTAENWNGSAPEIFC